MLGIGDCFNALGVITQASAARQAAQMQNALNLQNMAEAQRAMALVEMETHIRSGRYGYGLRNIAPAARMICKPRRNAARTKALRRIVLWRHLLGTPWDDIAVVALWWEKRRLKRMAR